MKHITILLGVCLLVLCSAPVHALFAGDDGVSGYWCPFFGRFMDEGMENNILSNDIPNSPPIISVLVEEAKYGTVILSQNGRVFYAPNSNEWDITQAQDSFRYRTFDGIEYSNDATVDIFLLPHYLLHHGEELKFSTPKDTMLSAQILEDYGWETYMEWDNSGPGHGTLTIDYGGYWEGDNYIETGQTSHFHYMPDPGFEGVDHMEYRISIDTADCGTMWGTPGTIEITVGNSNPVPEFPSTVLPVIFVIGFLGAVLLIHRTRES